MSQSSEHTLLCTSISRLMPSATSLPLLSQSCIFTTCDSFQYHLPLLEQFVFLLFLSQVDLFPSLITPSPGCTDCSFQEELLCCNFLHTQTCFPLQPPPTFLICQLQSLLRSYSHTSQAPTHIPTTRKTDQRRSRDPSLTTTAYLNTTKAPSKSHLSFFPPWVWRNNNTHPPSQHCARCSSSPQNRIYLNFGIKKKKKASFLLQQCMPKFSCYKLLKKITFKAATEKTSPSEPSQYAKV